MTEETTFSVARDLPAFHRRWFRACGLGIAGFFALHGLYLLPAVYLPVAFTTPVGFLLFSEGVFFFALAMVALILVLVLVPCLGALALLVPRSRRGFGSWVETTPGTREWAFKPWVHSLAWTILFLGHMGLEIDPYLAAVCLSGVLLLLPEFWAAIARWWAPRGGRRRALVAPVLAALWLLFSTDAGIAVAVVVWCIVLFLLSRPLAPGLVLRDRFALAFLCMPAIHLLAAFFPMWFPPANAEKLGGKMAYSFCEVAAGDRLFAAVPRCSPRQSACQNGTVDEFDARTLELREQYHFFSERYHGRLEGLLCFGDHVEVGLDATFVDGKELAQNMLEFRLDDPTKFTTNALGAPAGDGIAYDPKRNAVFYRDDKEAVIRRDLATGTIDRKVAARSGLSAVAAIDFSAKRDSLLVLSYYGRLVELDAGTMVPRATYPIINAWDFVVDEERGRLYIGGNWGLEVLDLTKGKVIRRARLGLGARRPAIDRRNEVIYVPCTGSGRMYAFDRRTLKKLGSVPVGIGIRYPYVSDRYGHVFASSDRAHFSWNAALLARRLRGQSSAGRDQR